MARDARCLAFALLFACAATAAPAAGFDHRHAAWDALLARHVRLAADGNASRVDYRGFAADRGVLQRYLASLSAVPQAQFDRWSKAQQFAFLANAHNAFTIERVLTRYPHFTSIRDFGRVFGNPWKDEFFTLLGARRSLDWIEHDVLRAPDRFDDPRVHLALNCASIGCPMLLNHAFTAAVLDAQLDDLMRRLMSDRTRNRYDPRRRVVELSPIFDWYGRDFAHGHHGYSRLQDLVANYADQLADAPADRQALRAGSVPIRFLDYDWTLNDLR
jgi:hypothetical protein